jgi:hypothetical protein
MAVNYDPTKVQVVVGGDVITGFAEGSMIKISRMTEKRSSHVGAQGEVTFVKSADDRAEVTITLKHTSPANAKLMSLYKSDEEFEFAVSDQNFKNDVGGSGSRCVIKNIPDFERGNELTENEWVLIVADYEEAIQL